MKRWFLVLLLLPIFCSAATKAPYHPYTSSRKTIKPLIVVDAGHGGLDLGAKIRKPYTEEKRLTLASAILLKKHLNRLGYRVLMTRSSDIFIPLAKRASIANRSKSEIFVSLHFNSCPNKVANGIEIYYHSNGNKYRTNSSRLLAQNTLKRAVLRTKLTNRGVKKASFKVIKEAKMPSILVEGGFLTNQQERAKLRNRAFLDQLTRGIAEGIDSFIKSRKKAR
jgi:N-acetylmuramoyl-L-alanine amidase